MPVTRSSHDTSLPRFRVEIMLSVDYGNEDQVANIFSEFLYDSVADCPIRDWSLTTSQVTDLNTPTTTSPTGA